jgi:type VI secretion system secreted protein Hcp
MAQMDAFLMLDRVKGESVDETYAGHMEILSWSWGMSNSGSAHRGKGAGTGATHVSDVSIMKRVDTSTPTLMDFCVRGEHISKGKIVIRKSGGSKLEYYIVEMEEIMISGVQNSGSGPDMTESLSFNFAKFKMKYVPQLASGAGGSPVPMGYDISAGKTWG